MNRLICYLDHQSGIFKKIYIARNNSNLGNKFTLYGDNMIGIGTNLQLQIDGWGWACGGLFCLIWLLPLIISLVIGYWMYKDAEKRNENGVLWFIIGFFLSIIGLIIWIVVRPDMSEVRREEQMAQQPQQQQWQQPQQQQQQQPPQQQQEPPQQQQQQAKQCSDCASEMRYIDEYDRWYCDNCQEYK